MLEARLVQLGTKETKEGGAGTNWTTPIRAKRHSSLESVAVVSCMIGGISTDPRHPNIHRHAVADGKPTGQGRASVDSMVYSSDQGGSPNTTVAGEEGTGRRSTGAAAGGPAAASKIPVSVLAWLNDDDSGGSSDEAFLPSSQGDKFAGSTAPPVRHSSRSAALGRLVPAQSSGSSSGRQGAVAAAAAAAAAAVAAAAVASIAAGRGGHSDPRKKEVGSGKVSDTHDTGGGGDERPPPPASRAGDGNNAPKASAAAAQGASGAQRQLPAESTAILTATSRTPLPQKGLRGLAVHAPKPAAGGAVGKREAENDGSSGSRSWNAGEREMHSWLSQASDDDDDETEEESRGGRSRSGKGEVKRISISRQPEMGSTTR